MPIKPIDKDDDQYETLVVGFNQRWPEKRDDFPNHIYVCSNETEAKEALQAVLDAKKRPTIRSGGHCYEDFVANNPGGAIIDIGLMSGIEENPKTQTTSQPYKYRMWAGSQNWNSAVALYKRHNKTIPGGSCYSVGAGGHISGGGYGFLSRLHGLTVDWVSGVDVLIADKKVGEAPQVRLVHANAKENPDLFKACRGAGGGSFGLITSFYFDDLPKAPRRVLLAMLQSDWANFINEHDKDDSSKLLALLNDYANFFKKANEIPESYGLFSALKINTIVQKNITISIQYCDKNDNLQDTKQLNEFLAMLQKHKFVPQDKALHDATIPFILPTGKDKLDGLPDGVMGLEWLYATQTLNQSGANQRGKYKSAYMKDVFTAAEADALLKYFVNDARANSPDFANTRVAIDSYGGMINRKSAQFNPADNKTAIPQRSSILKLQYQTYWADKHRDNIHLEWMKEMYSDVYGADGFVGTPYPGPDSRYEGCYINYPDIDMLGLEGSRQHGHTSEYSWGELYYGDELFNDLKNTKAVYDPFNIFNHRMSIPSTVKPFGGSANG